MSSERRETRTGGRAATTAVIAGRYAFSVGKPDLPAPQGWTWTRLEDVARLESGHTPSRRKPEWWDGDVPWIGIKDATQNHGRVIEDTIQHTNELGIANSSARVLPAHTVCLSRTASVGYVVVMGKPMATSQDFVNWVCEAEHLDWRYLKSVLVAEKNSLLRFASGTTHQTIYFPEVKAFHVCLPPIEEQRRIADVLASLDDKIQSNKRLSEVLQSFNSTLFQHRVAHTTDESFFDSSDLTTIARFVNGRAFTKDANGEGRPILRIKELNGGLSDSTLYSDIKAADDNIARHHDVLFSWSGSLELYRWHGPESLINQHIFKVLPLHGFPDWFVAGWVRHHMPEFQRIAQEKATTMGHIKREHLKLAAVRIPPPAVIAELDSLLGPLERQLAALASETLTLIAIRDSLLPRLISGQLRLSTAPELTDISPQPEGLVA